MSGGGRATVDFASLRAEAAEAPFAYTNVELGMDDLESGTRPFHGVTDVWVFDPLFEQVLLVDHPRRGWVMPGGRVEVGEDMREAAVRELAEETGVVVDRLDLRPAALYLGLDPGVTEIRVGIAFATIVPTDVTLVPEDGMGLGWWSLEDSWPSIFPHDRSRLLAWRDHLRGSGLLGPGR